MDSGLEGGLADPVHEAQRAFRAVLDALANPGQIQELAVPAAGNTPVLPPGLGSILLTLTDHDTPIWLADCYRLEGLAAFIGFHTGAPLVTDPARAQFAFCDAASLPSLDRFNLGTQDYPDRSTSVVVAVPALSGGAALSLRGPGIRTEVMIAPTGLPADFVTQWAANRELFPRGIDLLLVCGNQVVGLPRSTRIEEA